MNNPKDQQSGGIGNRKTSLSMVNTAGSRPGTRRRETSDSFTANGPLSPTENKSFRFEPSANTPPAALLRRRTDIQDDSKEKDESKPAADNSPFNSLGRIGTAGPPSAGFNPPSASPWSAGPQSAFGSMGTFGNLANESGAFDPPAQRPGFGSARSISRFKDILAKPNEDVSPSVKEKPSFNGLEKLPEEEDSAQSRLREHIRNRPNRSETNPYDDLMPGRTGSAALSTHDEAAVMEQTGFNPYAARESSAHTPHHRFSHDPTSPTNTNPYQSPQGGRLPDDDGQEAPPGTQPFGRRDVFAGVEHRGQNSFGSMRGMGGGLGGLGGLGGWTNPGFGTGTPGRDRPPVSAAFGDPVFSPLGGDLGSPGAFGGNSFFAGGPFTANARGSRLGLPFPPAMQDQMRSDSRNDAARGRLDPFEPPRNAFETFDEGRRPGEDAFGQGPINRTPPGLEGRAASAGVREGSDSNSPERMPTAQQRQMVMPDRMRWVYRDPHGQVQGPWSGLEMHDWFKAGFFTAELQVKKHEDIDYEPLAQLVRRIGNSREPFLVPQIGVPHGPPTANPWSPGGPPTSGQPPFASAFPSFGTTLTAEQQNALERRKQEEQFLMARQKEFLATRQVQMHSGGASGQYHSLQHQASGHSLHSQPSFGSITSPAAGFNPSPMPAPIGQPPAGFGGPPQNQEHDLQAQMGRLGIESQGPYTGLANRSFAAHERNRLSMENQQAQHEQTFLGLQGRNERLEEFHELRQDLGDELVDDALPAPIGSQRPPTEEVAALKERPAPIGAPKKQANDNEPMSLTQQVQRQAAANKQAAEDKPIVEPPPVSISPLPAPAAQRSRPPVAEQLAAESRSTTQTPVEAPSASIAPWADKTAEVTRGPSLKEIQEAEAKRAAEQEALMAEARRVAMEQERLQTEKVVPPAPGLPLTSTWATSGSPSTPTTPGGGVWSKPVPAKTGSTTTAKKTLAQIQKEEEARKMKAAAQAALSAQTAAYTNPTLPAGNRYAQMASKATAAPSGPTPVHAHAQSAGTGAWTTVGASGKPKTPATVVATPAVAQRTVSSTAVPRPALASTRSVSTVNTANNTKDAARQSFLTWAKSSLSKSLIADASADVVVNMLYELPTETETLHDAVYACTANSAPTGSVRGFVDEFIRRRRLADRGVIVDADPKATGMAAGAGGENKSNGGWSEVAKKPAGALGAAPKEDPGFKTVSKKKKTTKT